RTDSARKRQLHRPARRVRTTQPIFFEQLEDRNLPSGDLMGQGVPIQAAEGVAFHAATVARFHDPVAVGGTPAPASEFQTSIDWGDGSPVTPGGVQLVNSSGDYVV